MLCLVTQSCLTLCDPMHCSPPGSSVHGDFSGTNTGVGCHLLSPTAKPPVITTLVNCLAESGSDGKLPVCPQVRLTYWPSLSSALPALPDSISSYEAQITSLKQERQQQQQDCEEKERELGRLKQLLSRAHPLDSLEKQMEKVGVGIVYLPPPRGLEKMLRQPKVTLGHRVCWCPTATSLGARHSAIILGTKPILSTGKLGLLW